MDRYSRQVMFKDIGKEGQKTIRNAAIAIIGVGALGSVSAELLTRAGIGKLILFDADVIEESNLQRQSLYTEKDIGDYKVDAAKKHLSEINSEVEIKIFSENITSENIQRIKADVIIDGTDNMETRFLLNEYAKKNKTPYIYGAAAGSIGVIYNIMPDGPCLNCIFKNAKNFATCQTDGVINTATHIVSGVQAAEALKILLNKNPSKDIIRIDSWKNTFDKISVKKYDDCPVCNGRYSLLERKDDELFTVQECKTKSAFTAKPKKKTRLDIKKITTEFKTIEDAEIIAVIKVDGEEIIVHDYGELLFKTLKDKEKIKDIAKKIYAAGGYD